MPNPRGRSTAVVAPEQNGALALPDDMRADLLAAQRGMIEGRAKLPQIKILPAAAGLYEFTDTNDTLREFSGVILGSHARNVLWERAYGSTPAPEQTVEQTLPVCVSNDGRFGVPRQGFPHAALQRRGASAVLATGTERINCKTCPYNQWGSKHLMPGLMRPGDNGKGKATTNQRVVYVLVAGRAVPMELILPPTSITPYEEYLSMLTNMGTPVQAIGTVFTQNKVMKNGQTYAVPVFGNGGSLDQQTFDHVLEVRSEWLQTIEGRTEELVVQDAEIVDAAAGAATTDESIPF